MDIIERTEKKLHVEIFLSASKNNLTDINDSIRFIDDFLVNTRKQLEQIINNKLCNKDGEEIIKNIIENLDDQYYEKRCYKRGF